VPSAPDREDWPPSGVGSPGFFDVIDLEQEELKSLFSVDSGEHPTIPPAGPVGSEGPEASETIPAGFLDLSPRDRDRTREAGPVFGMEPGPGLIDRDPSRGSREAPSLKGPTSTASRPRSGRDVVMPRLAFVSWSLFVLLALFLAFVSGLLAGRFVWTGPA
jgi:hypothetical protein